MQFLQNTSGIASYTDAISAFPIMKFFLQQPSGKPKCLPSSHAELHDKGYKAFSMIPSWKFFLTKSNAPFKSYFNCGEIALQATFLYCRLQEGGLLDIFCSPIRSHGSCLFCHTAGEANHEWGRDRAVSEKNMDWAAGPFSTQLICHYF